MLNSDTLKGFIDYKASKKSSQSCDFKSSLSGETKTYKPSDIKGYGFENDRFLQTIALKNAENKAEPIFVEVLVRGTVSLYKDPAAFYVAKGDTALHRLSINKDIVYVGDKAMRRRSNRHIGILTYMLQDCETITANKIKKVAISEKILTDLIEEYNGCVSSSYVSFKEAKPWLRARYGATAGYRLSKLSFFILEESHLNHLERGNFNSQDMEYGALIELYSPRINERLAFTGGVLLSGARYSFYEEKPGFGTVYKYTTEFDAKELKFPAGLQYRFSVGKYSPFISLGLSYTLNLQANYHWMREHEAYGRYNKLERRDFPFGKRQFGYWGGIGVERKIKNRLKAYTEFRFEETSGYVDLFDLNAPVNSIIRNLHFNIGFKF